MIENATVSIYVKTTSKNSEGTPITSWGYKAIPVVAPVETIRADVQPARLTEMQMQQYGLNNRDSDAKKIFFLESAYMTINNRIYVVSDFPNEPATYYEIKGSNHWPFHGECIAVPVQGE